MRAARLAAASAALAALAALTACARPQRPLSDRLARTVDGLQGRPPCTATIPLDWAHSWPVPRPDGGVTVFFYPLAGTPASGPTVYAPAGEAAVDASGTVASCRKLPGPSRQLSSRRWSADVDHLDMPTFERRAAELYDDTEAVARLYVSGVKVSGEPRAVAKRYVAEFKALAEPDLLDYYYRMAPGFWEWLREAAGDSIPKA